ncbi:hypothetical protein DFJ73DRAFT_905612, partial [Zopfochytrium polystomum]
RKQRLTSPSRRSAPPDPAKSTRFPPSPTAPRNGNGNVSQQQHPRRPAAVAQSRADRPTQGDCHRSRRPRPLQNSLPMGLCEPRPAHSRQSLPGERNLGQLRLLRGRLRHGAGGRVPKEAAPVVLRDGRPTVDQDGGSRRTRLDGEDCRDGCEQRDGGLCRHRPQRPQGAQAVRRVHVDVLEESLQAGAGDKGAQLGRPAGDRGD